MLIDPAAPTILLADDSPILRKHLVSVLERNGFRVVTAGDGVEAVDALVRERCDLVIMDISMPRMDGLEATATIRGSTTSRVDPNIPIIALTAHDTPEDAERFRQAGMTGYVTKPVTPQTLLAAVEDHLPPTATSVLAQEYGLQPEELEGLYAAMAADLPGRITALEKAATGHDADSLAGTAHYLAGSGLSLVAPHLARAAKALERDATKGWQDSLLQRTADLASQIRIAIGSAHS